MADTRGANSQQSSVGSATPAPTASRRSTAILSEGPQRMGDDVLPYLRKDITHLKAVLTAATRE